MNVASAAHSCPEKFTACRPPRPNGAHPFAAFASASGCKGIFQFIPAIAPQFVQEQVGQTGGRGQEKFSCRSAIPSTAVPRRRWAQPG